MKRLRETPSARRRNRPLWAVLAIVSGVSASARAQSTKPTSPANSQARSTQVTTFTPIKLRGYGLVSGRSTTRQNGSALLTIETESLDKARLLQAKYLSDLSSLPNVRSATLKVGSVQILIQEALGQGLVAALRNGKTVVIATGRDTAELLALLKALPAAALAESHPSVEVPMYLDRWDKFNFRHYYRTWGHPKGTTEESYDYVHEFDWAKEQGRAGFVFWDAAMTTDSAAGMMNYGWWDWAANEAAKRKLPVGLNMGGQETWLLNEFRDQTEPKMPDFTGNFYALASPSLGGQGVISWSASSGQDAWLGLLQDSVKRFVASPNVTTFLEPHAELKHGNQDIFLEYGPVADTGYRSFLQSKYGSVDKVAARWGRDLKSWADVRLPEIATFSGWGPDALDIGGLWRVGYETLTGEASTAWNPHMRDKIASVPAPSEWFQPAFDDSTWPELKAPGDDRALFLVKRPAVFRRSFDVPATWKTAHPHIWLYEWDLDLATGDDVKIVLNGAEIGTSKVRFNSPHWSAVDVSSALLAGRNTLAIRLPQGYNAYKTYLSSVAPRQYPNLGETLNAQWVDFTDFTQWSRVKAVERGMKMIRQVAPEHQIVLMSPTAYGDGVKSMASEYGGELHDTGAMAAFYDDLPALLSRGADLPTSAEPGSPAKDLTQWKHAWDRWQTEGVQGVDYFIHLGDVLWDPEIKAYYESHRKQIALMGQNHFAKAETAVLYSDRIAQLTGFPWGGDPNGGFGGGYWEWNAGSVLRGTFATDGLTQSSFANGEADGYKVVVDSNTSMMDESMVSDIEKWVRAGGTFITLAQTGRSTPERPDSWPISRLTGYKVTKIDRLKENGSVDESGTLRPAADQQVYKADWNGVVANGLHLEKVAENVQNLLLWSDGSVAAGARRLGKGFIVELGAKFTGQKIDDRVEPGENKAETLNLRRLLQSVLDWRGVRHEPAHLTQENSWVLLRPGVTNNGLYDTWMVCNWSEKNSYTVSVALDKDRSPSFAFESRTGANFPVSKTPDGVVLKDIVLEPQETRVFLTPRNQIGNAPVAWFDLQRKWWRGAVEPDPKELPRPLQEFVRDLTPDWKFQPVALAADATPMTASGFDDSKWKNARLDIWDAKELGPRALFRKRFTVPADWKDGRITFWLTSWEDSSFVETGTVLLDGKEIKRDGKTGLPGIEIATLTPGSEHALVVDTRSSGVLAGFRGETWLAYEPSPLPGHSIDLAGQWQPSRDALKFDAPIAVPGTFDAQMLQRNALVGENFKGKTVTFTVDGDAQFVGVIVNGTLVRRHHHLLGERWSLNITPFVHFGEQNTFVLVTGNNSMAKRLREVRLAFH